MTAAPVSHPVIPVLAERGGTQLQTPRPTLFVDTREQNPFNFSRFRGMVCGNRKESTPAGRLLHRRIGRCLRRGAKGSLGPGSLLHGRTDRLHQPSPAHGSVSASAVGDYEHAESGQISVCPRERRPEPDNPVLDRRPCWAAGSVRLQRDARVGRRTRWLRTSTRFTSTTGWSPTITAGFCQTTTYKG